MGKPMSTLDDQKNATNMQKTKSGGWVKHPSETEQWLMQVWDKEGKTT